MPRFATTRLRLAAALLVGSAASALLGWTTAAGKAETNYAGLRSFRRLWSDQALAISQFLDARHPLSPAEAARLPADASQRYREIMIEKIRRRRVKPVQFWRTIPDRPFRKERQRIEAGGFDDPGRAIVLAFGFRVLGGISPFLILWLGALFAAPLIIWTAWEFIEVGHASAGGVFVLTLASSSFVVETLALPRHAVGFYLIGLLALVPLSVRACLGRPPSALGILLRLAAAGIILGVAALCRSSALFLAPGFLLAAGVGLRRTLRSAGWMDANAPRSRRAMGATAAGLVAVALLLTPYLLLRQPRQHESWAAIWEGLGDFDRSKGHVWSDEAAGEVLLREGGPPREPSQSLVAWLSMPESAAVLRDQVIQDVKSDPAWFLGILVKRLFAVVTQSRLGPWTPRDGLWLALNSSPNEGYMQKYYGYTATADFFGFGVHAWELPVTLLLAPTFVLVLLRILPERWRSESSCLAAAGPGPLWVIASVAVACAGLPILITTAGAQETQAFAFVYFLGFAFLVEDVARALASFRRRGGPAGAAEDGRDPRGREQHSP